MSSISPNEVRIYRRILLFNRYVVRTHNDLFAPLWARFVEAGEHVSLSGAGPTATFTPASLITENGDLSLQSAALVLGPELAQTSDGVQVATKSVCEFHVPRRRRVIERLLDEGRLKTLGASLANRCRAILSAEIGAMHYGDAIEHQGETCARILEQLRPKGRRRNAVSDLGVVVTDYRLQVWRSGEEAAPAADTPLCPDLDLGHEARRLIRFLREANPDRDEREWLDRMLVQRVALERTHLLANGKATVIVSEGGLERGEAGDMAALLDIRDARPGLRADRSPLIELAAPVDEGEPED